MQSRAFVVVLLASVLAASDGGVARGAVAPAVDTAHKNVAALVALSTDTTLSGGRGSLLTCTARRTGVLVEGARPALATWLNVKGDPSALVTWLNVKGDPSALATWPMASAETTSCTR